MLTYEPSIHIFPHKKNIRDSANCSMYPAGTASTLRARGKHDCETRLAVVTHPQQVLVWMTDFFYHNAAEREGVVALMLYFVRLTFFYHIAAERKGVRCSHVIFCRCSVSHGAAYF